MSIHPPVLRYFSLDQVKDLLTDQQTAIPAPSVAKNQRDLEYYFEQTVEAMKRCRVDMHLGSFQLKKQNNASTSRVL